ncbi:amine oxidase [Cordyceps militaris]|uniref:Amine oxidase n=1 Tax=Cordyceps militaris TaxID=73501 RepID=A0A2H4SHY2_CORMI|nr:amine oxidase [Cordyceps militaris]
MASKTVDGYTWEPATGVVKGLQTDAVVKPAQSLGSKDNIYDAVVIGAGYAGLAAARDLALAGTFWSSSYSGRSVLLLEARDRIGGRTYTVNKDGFLYEMGGTWVTHHMGYLFREMQRYGMDRDLVTTGSPDMHKGYYTMNVPGAKPRTLSHEEAGAMQAKAWDVFVNVDGQYGRTLCPLPHAQLDNIMVDRETVEKWDQFSCQDRFDQIQDQLTTEEQGLLVSLLLHISGGDMQTSSLWDMIRSHALLMHSSDNFTDVWLRYKLRAGQTELAKRMFHDAKARGIDFSFSSPVQSISQGAEKDGEITVATHGEGAFRARRVISTIPLNVLKDIAFSPPLSKKRQEAIDIGHVNHMTKIHADVRNPELERWNGMQFPGLLLYGYGDGRLPNGNVHLVAFGADEREHFVPENNPELAVESFKKLHPMDIQRLIFHNWSTDVYAKGGPAWWRPGYMSKYQDELQSRHGNIFFASADWAHGWRAAIDGALEQGSLAAQSVDGELGPSRPSAAVESKL